MWQPCVRVQAVLLRGLLHGQSDEGFFSAQNFRTCVSYSPLSLCWEILRPVSPALTSAGNVCKRRSVWGLDNSKTVNKRAL